MIARLPLLFRASRSGFQSPDTWEEETKLLDPSRSGIAVLTSQCTRLRSLSLTAFEARQNSMQQDG